MLSLKDLRNRIRAIRSIQKITAAMQMVSAAKLKRSQQQSESFKLYSQAFYELLGDLPYKEFAEIDLGPDIKRLFCGGEGPPLFLVLSSDRGLCGGYNFVLMKTLKSLMERHRDCKVAILGDKGLSYLESKWRHKIIELPTIEKNASPAQVITDFLMNLLNQGVVGSVDVIHYGFRNILYQDLKVTKLIPFSAVLSTSGLSTNKSRQGENSNLVNCDLGVPLFLMEPSRKILMQQLMGECFLVELNRILLERDTCEQAARLKAMDSATRNSQDMLQDLKKTYNRTRQSQITNQLIEIISASQVL